MNVHSLVLQLFSNSETTACDITSDWLTHMAEPIKKMLQMYKTLEKKAKNAPENDGEYGPRFTCVLQSDNNQNYNVCISCFPVGYRKISVKIFFHLTLVPPVKIPTFMFLLPG